MPSDALEVARDRAILFIDGSNWYHALRANGVRARGELSYPPNRRPHPGPGPTRMHMGHINHIVPAGRTSFCIDRSITSAKSGRVGGNYVVHVSHVSLSTPDRSMLHVRR